MFKRVLFTIMLIVGVICLTMLIPVAILSEPIADTTATPVIPAMPAGFDMLYVVFFAVGMIVHFCVKLIDAAGGWSKLGSAFTGQFFSQLLGWFGNKFHLTLLAGVPAAMVAVCATYGIDIVPLTSVTWLGALVAIGAGYVGDSAFNNIGSNPLVPKQEPNVGAGSSS